MTAASYASGTSEVPLIGETIGATLARIAAQHPDAEAVVDVPAGRRWTYAQLHDDVRRLAAGLLAAGIRPGDRVALWAPNCGEWILLQHATATMGAILVNVNPNYRTHELSYALRQSGAKLLVTLAQFRTSNYRAMVEEVRGECSDLADVVYLGEDAWAALCAGVPGPELDEAAEGLSFDDPINIQYTSGTTGFPKGATLTHHNLVNNGFSLGEVMAYTPADRVCVPVPFYHCFGMVIGNLAALTHASCVIVPAPVFDPAATLAACAAEKATSLYGVPTMFIAMLADPSRPNLDLSSLRTGMMAGSPCPVEVMKRVIGELGMDEVTIGYGMTETSPVSTQTRIGDDLDRQTGTVGRVHPHMEIGVFDPETDRIVPRGERGEFRARGYHVMRGYWNEPEKTAEAIDAGGWMHTGDLAEMDADGYVRIVGRIKDTVIRGGENIAPREVEEFLYSHPDVLDVQVVGVPDVKYGEELCACIRQPPDAAPLDAVAVREFCAGKISHHKIPKYVVIVHEYPMTITGKVQKFVLREQMTQALGLDEL
ncbi:MAG: AMP-binding protein [Sporichthyaceae bacterium]